MPIRFRCAYCNQLLGISRRKAGSVVQCPKCAGQVIVPPQGPEEEQFQGPPNPLLEDGNVAALPEPGEQAIDSARHNQADVQLLPIGATTAHQFIVLSRRKAILLLVALLVLSTVTFVLGYFIGRSALLSARHPAVTTQS